MTAFRLAVCVLPLLSGCALWHDFETPATDTPARWNTGSSGSLERGWPDAAWWQEFGSPELTAQIEEARKANLDIAAAVARVRQADAQLSVSGAPLFPALGSNLTGSRDRTPGGRVSAVGVSSRPQINNNFNATLNASYELDFWGKNYAARESARETGRATRFDEETVALTVTATVANTYFDIIATQDRLRLARRNLAAAEELLAAYRQRFEAGISSGLEVAQQESLVTSQKAAIPPLELRLRQNYNAQGVLLGKLHESLGSSTQPLDAINVPDIGAGVPSELLTRRPDVANAEAALASAHASVITARAAFFPSIVLGPRIGYAAADWDQLIQPDSMLYSLAGGITQPIFQGGLLSGQLGLAKGRHEELVANYRKTVISAFANVGDALAAVQQHAELEDSQRQAAAAARRASDLTQLQLSGGIADITVLLNTQRVLFTAQDAAIQARLARLQSAVSLYRALGGGWKKGGDGELPPSRADEQEKKGSRDRIF